jgi:uncharacterized damage-inducible protein DinB
MLTKQKFVEIFEWELPVFTKVIRAVPEDYYKQKPQDKSRTSEELISTLIVELQYTYNFLKGQSADIALYQNPPQFSSVAQAADHFEKLGQMFLDDLEATAEDDLNQKVFFFHRESTSDDAIFNMLLDLIHHRGQLSVYIRLGGGKVPSIYGPSADEGMPA